MNAGKLRSKLPKETWEPLVFYLIFHTRLFENLLRLGVCLTEGKLDFRGCKRLDCCSAETNWIAWALLHRLTLFLLLILQFHASEMLKQTERIFKNNGWRCVGLPAFHYVVQQNRFAGPKFRIAEVTGCKRGSQKVLSAPQKRLMELPQLPLSNAT